MNTVLFPARGSRGVSMALALLFAAAVAGEASAQSAAPAPATRASGKEYALTHASSFDAPPSGSRNPFWPIGWTPSTAVAPAQMAAVQQPDVKAEQFVVTTISVDYPPLAIINGKNYGVGDQIPVTADRREFVTVKQILDGMVVLDYRGHELRSMTSAANLTRKAK